ncbi:zinc-binding alcohol dehydrogenase family protein [Pseudohongiella sp.]|uniref:Enoyl reductase (ER) domain-containing protein n=1 Tax=marine sediment metagenome TaxID=412755 RepID=A0A0F9Z172_9ZZZZ|nr:zinc-binding alcohol dehydrogenase family protein [Pseudohongiella sp.]HDZ08395.1 zinc-binding alcohol dehydrogenase family protein [Pseudohongiella sp.]HEA62760.1 zinc-binding alcohol dehydrogenase family protein [Pseudohongiella sp.]
MKAVGYTDGPLFDFDAPTPVPGPRDLLVEVSAIAVNPVDTKIRGRVKPEDGTPKVLGWDAVGRVTAVGAQVKSFKVGDRIWYAGDVSRGGCNAQLQCVDERIAALAPTSLSDAEAAALPLTTITAWEMLFDRLQIPGGDEGAGRVLLIVGASGGVGSMLVQLARQLTRATVIATASRPQSKAWVEQLGAHHVLDHSQSLQAQLAGTGLADITDAACVNRTGQHYADIVAMMRPQGRICLIDDPIEPLDIKLMKQKSLSLHWEFMFTRPLFSTADMSAQHALLSEVAQLIDKGLLRTTLGEHFGVVNAANLERAHDAMKTEHTIGKVVLEGFDA